MATWAKDRLSKLGAGEPADFNRTVDVVLQMQYDVNADGKFEFSYRKAFTPAENVAFLTLSLEEAAWSTYAEQEAFKEELDIGIKGGDTVVQIDTVGPGLFWSRDTDAIMTAQDVSEIYGELRYWDGGEWVRREEFRKPFCQRIRFKAKHDSDGPKGQAHKFSYFVLLINGDGDLIEHEIDPEIQNPKT